MLTWKRAALQDVFEQHDWTQASKVAALRTTVKLTRVELPVPMGTEEGDGARAACCRLPRPILHRAYWPARFADTDGKGRAYFHRSSTPTFWAAGLGGRYR